MSTFRRSCSVVGWGWTGTCLAGEVPVFDGDGTGDANRAIEACRWNEPGAGEPVRLGLLDMGTGPGLMVEGPSPLSDMPTSRQIPSKDSIAKLPCTVRIFRCSIWDYGNKNPR